jgi:hypothetical protein
LANPNYVLQDINGTDVLVTFWFTAFTTVKDIDGTIIYIPHTLTMDEEQFLKKDVKKLTMTVEVYNPRQVEYSISYDEISKINGRKSTYRGFGIVAISDLTYRLHTLDLSFSENLTSSTFSVKIYSRDIPLFMLGPLQYRKGG